MIAVTGHTSGIGKGIYNCIDCNGFSRTNGYNIQNHLDRKKLLSADPDILINNAYCGIGQTLLLLDFFKKYQNTNKTIINIGSRIAEHTESLPDEYQDLLEYQMYKQALKNTYINLEKQNKKVNLKYIWFGYVGTDNILAKYPNIENYITVEDAATQILELI